MPSIRLSRLSFSYADPICLFDRVTLEISSGFTGVVGENGSGKSTLLALVAGDLSPTQGALHFDPAEQICHLCPQRTHEITPAIEELAGSWQRVAIRWMDRLALEPEDIERWPSLSPGQRKRWQLAAALARRPDVLLLDEPTNHVDERGKDIIIQALSRFRGICLLVSHDRGVLDALTHRTIRIAGGRVESYRGNYSQAREQWLADAARDQEAYEQARARQRAVARRLADKRRQRAAAEARVSVRSRSKGPRDSDARSVAAKERVRAGEARLARSVAVERRCLERADQVVDGFSMRRRRGRSLFVDYEPAAKNPVLTLEREVICAGSAVLLRQVRVAVARDDRVHVRGANGVGKTTLMRALYEDAGSAASRLLYIPQDIEPGAGSAVRDQIMALPRDERGQVFQLAAALGMDPERIMGDHTPSPGEARKLLLAYGLGRRVWALLLDEPTNHLDIPSIERLEDALVEYPGAMVVISHDERFASRVTSAVWTLDSGRVHL